jgi:hypothetical protein
MSAAAAANTAAANTAAVNAFFRKMGENFRKTDKPHLKMANFMVIFEKEEGKTARFVFKSYDNDNGITCFPNEATKVAKALPTVYDYLRQTREGLEAEADKSEIEGCVYTKLIQQNLKFEKRLEIRISNQRAILTLTLYLLDTNDGQPCPCSGSVAFEDEEDDPKRLLDFILLWAPEEENQTFKKANLKN